MKKFTILLSIMLLCVIGVFAQNPIATFTAAALNVDGMPVSLSVAGITINLNPDGKEEAGATAIGNKLAETMWDVVALSEDFNFHDELYAPIKDLYNAGTHQAELGYYVGLGTNYLGKKTLFETDGLGFLSRKTLSVSGETLTTWNEHFGYKDNGADGLINKGFRSYTVTFAQGVVVDVYILHMDAETDAGDIAARESQMAQLAEAILSSNNKRPIIVMGDTNCRYTRDKLKSNFVDVLNADSRFTFHDAWVETNYEGVYPQYGGGALMVGELGYAKGEVVDKLFFINNSQSDIQLKLKSFESDTSFVNDAGEPLADHYPVVGEFEVYKTSVVGTDEVAENLAGEVYYVRNVETGQYLKSGGWWGTHAMQGEYGLPITFKQLSDGKYTLSTPISNPNAADSHYLTQGDPYMDGTAAKWTLISRGNMCALTYEKDGGTKALTANDPTPGYVTCANYNSNDSYQQWELLTKEQLVEEMRAGVSLHPVNATFLLRGAGFDKDDAEGRGMWDNTISATASKMHYNLCDGKVDIEYGNPVAEVYVESYSSGSYETRWEIGQTISNIPNGRYKIKMQGFYRVKDHNQNLTGTADVFLYGRSGGQESKTLLCQVYDTKISTPMSDAQTSEGYYVPNSMAHATLFFNAGYYQNEVEVEVTDGTLAVAVGKENTSKGSSVWTCFDNFQLLYLEGPDAIPLTIRQENKWGTLILPFNAPVPEGMHVMYIEDVDPHGVLCLAETPQIEAKKPYVVYAENGIETTFKGTIPTSLDDIYSDGKYMTGVLGHDGYVPAQGDYLLQNHQNRIAFYRIGTEWGSKAIPQFRCFVNGNIDIPSSVKALFFEENEETSLKPCVEQKQTKAFYDLNGRQVPRTKKGIILSNGKKWINP